jgi:pilus assembly protein Flp/PilA
MLQFVEMWLAQFDREEEGQGMVEYALILVLIAIAAIATMTLLGGQISSVFQEVTDTLSGV